MTMKEQVNPIDTQFFAKTYHGMAGHLEMIQNIIEHGYLQPDRTTIGCQKLFSQKVVFDMREGFPFYSIRPCPLRFAFEEYQAFLSGRTDIHNVLTEKGIEFWKGNTSREFLDKQGLQDIEEGHMAKAYGFQLRHFGGELDLETQQAVPDSGIDQMKEAFESLKKNPHGRRHYVTMWNPAQLSEMALPPCWHSHQWVVIEHGGVKYLNLEVTSRSADCVFGSPFNIQQYSYMLMAFANALGMTPLLLTCELVDAHVYTNQIEYAKEMLTRDYSTEKCELKFKVELDSFEDIVNLKWEDLDCILPEGFVNKDKFVTPRPPMAV